MTLRGLIEAVERGEWNQSAAWKVFGIGKTGQAERAYNGSLDAAKRLHDALLPGWIFDITNGSALVMENSPWDDDTGPQFAAESEGTSRAWLLCILKAMEAKSG